MDLINFIFNCLSLIKMFHSLWARFLLEGLKYLMFSFLRSGNEAKRGVEFRRSAWLVVRKAIKKTKKVFITNFFLSFSVFPVY